MLILYGHSPIIIDILKLKEIEYTQEYGNGHLIKTQDVQVIGVNLIIEYLDERYPVPQLIHGDINARYRMKTAVEILKQQPHRSDELVKEASPFVCGEQISLLDIYVAHFCKDRRFKRFIKEVINGH